jgi:hypothetical protein
MRRGQAAIARASLSAGSLRGQAAIEFLTTYGWAILALIVVFAAIISTGVLTPNYLVSEECTFGTSIMCNSALFNSPSGASSSFNLQLFNGFPYKIRIKNVSIQTQDGARQVEWTGFLAEGIDMDSGTNATVKGTVSGARFPAGSIKRFWGNITYVSCAPELGGCTENDHMITGRITAKVLEGS